ncbi:helix-turn-helix domain-containing protein [Panacibacter sp. DH6]|uniref:Helix-turn-helix domain-containing protein n=1 Tax=Panacibacter microcysteis TaxID=2793269 RepID=A0A931E514_9BACT|nr:AraC family transcriptional regulator [Panacibacter microcysteis]MBG9376292.1 helix-turn-helix domain-containing protein [Panacibacter microcysteis]
MNVECEIILPDEGSSFRLLHTRTLPEQYPWEYHYHPEFEIVCVLRGAGTRHVGNHFSSYDNGDLVLIGPNLPHAGFGLNAHGQHEEIVIQIREEVLVESIVSRPEMLPVVSLLEKSKFGICFKGAAKEQISRRLQKLLKLQPFERFIELLHVLYQMAVTTNYELLNPSTVLSQLTRKNNGRLQHILAYVEKHYNEDIDVKKAAAIANLSVPSFCNYFKKLMSFTFTDFINQYRIHRACVMLKQEKTIAEVSFACGFNNVAYFNKVFKTIMNKTPSQYKKEMQFSW